MKLALIIVSVIAGVLWLLLMLAAVIPHSHF